MKKSDHLLIQQVLDGSISQDAFAAFQNRMRAEPVLAKLYSEYALLNHSLYEEFEGQKWVGKSLYKPERSFSAFHLALAVAAVIAIVAAILFHNSIGFRASPPKMANTSFSMDALWQVDGAFLMSGNIVGLMPGSTLHLRQGQAGIALGSNATAVVEGPATVTFVSEHSLLLAEGRGRFRMEDPKGELRISTPSLTAVDLGTEFGIEVRTGQADELHVIDGKVRMLLTGSDREVDLTSGEAARVTSPGSVQRIPTDGKRFMKEPGHFKTIFSSPFVKADCRMQYGSPMISEEGMDGENYSAFVRLKNPEPADGNPVMLATLEVGKPSSGEFHTDGWAGMSFFNKGSEVLFFGDAFGTDRTWSLDVKQHIPVIIPGEPVIGPRTVTLCYHKKTGDVSLHEGGVPLGKAFCTGRLPEGLEFDEIRLGASAGAALDVRSLVIRVGGGG